MTVDDEKAQVRALRGAGLTIQQIAQQVGRSSGWVYSRLNDNYAPKRKRATVDDEPEDSGRTADDPALRQDIQHVRALRASGKTYQEIATALGRSVYWVHSRLRGEYQPRDARTERRFQEEAVIPWLLSHSHAIASQCQRVTYGAFVLEADIVSQWAGKRCITEVKAGANGHEIHTAIGQLTLHRCLASDGDQLLLQIALPEHARPARMDDGLLRALASGSGINVVFVPWTDFRGNIDGAV